MTLKTVDIPQPQPHPILKNLRELDIKGPVQSLIRLTQQYEGILKLELPGEELILVSSQELVNEVSDETRFHKTLAKPLAELRPAVGDGLFTAYGTEPNWGKAHRILMPAFGPGAIPKYVSSDVGFSGANDAQNRT